METLSKSRADSNFEDQRFKMVARQIRARGIADDGLLEVMSEIPRHLFVNGAFFSQAYKDSPLPIGSKQTISQPFMVALMTEALTLKGNERVLEIGTGSGYQAAVLARLCAKVYTIEKIPSLAIQARQVLDTCRVSNVVSRIGDGTCGWPEEAPFDAIIVTASYEDIPGSLVQQLAFPQGRLIMPVGPEDVQELIRLYFGSDRSVRQDRLGGCRFVRLVGKYGHKA